MRILVTGGAGFAGSGLALALKRDCPSREVVAIGEVSAEPSVRAGRAGSSSYLLQHLAATLNCLAFARTPARSVRAIANGTSAWARPDATALAPVPG
jgi:hypothetical protein